MAAFAVGRSQQLVYLLQTLMADRRIREMPIYIDSPMACNATKVYRDYHEDHDLSEGDLLGKYPALEGPRVHLARTTEESKAINRVSGPAVIISSSGMMTGGRIVHHLQQRLPNKKNTVVLGGFMAEGTRGRTLQNGVPTLRMFGRDVPINAAIETIPGLSGHVDRAGLLRWLEPLATPPRQTFLTHGEPESSDALAAELRSRRGWNVVCPTLVQSFELTTHH